jgi:hypothetical protein
VIVGAEAAGYPLPGKSALFAKVDSALDKDEKDFTAVAVEMRAQFANAGLNVFVFTSDLEYSLITAANKAAVAKELTSLGTNGVNYDVGYDLNQLRRQIGSKGVPMNPISNPPFKKPFVHQKIAETINLSHSHADIVRLLDAITAL